MSYAIKRAILLAVLVASAVWPAAHYFVVRRYKLSPWNWFGWAMYTQPAERLQVHAISPDGTTVTSRLPTLSEREQQSIMDAYRPWSLRHLELGDLDDPDEFARAILNVFDTWPSVRIEVQRFGLDRETASIARRSVSHYEYDRADVGLAP